MVSLFDLPQPIRFKIYQHVLISSFESAPSLEALHANETAQKIQRIHRHGSDVAEIAIERCIRYPFVISLPFAGLLRASKQTRSETKDVMQILKTRRIVYKLDLAIENEINMLPSWLKCPVRSTEVGRLDIDVRLLGFIDNVPPEFPLDGLQQHGRDRCRTLAFAVVALIARFIERGPRWEHLRQGEIRIQSIMLNFKSRWEDLEPHQKQLERSNSIEEERGLMDHLTLSDLHGHEEHHSAEHANGSNHESSTPARDPNEVVDARDLLRTVDLVLRPLCRKEEYTLERRQKHFSTGHLAFIRRNVRKIYLSIDGMPEKAMMVEN